jgi:hypothetical protein
VTKGAGSEDALHARDAPRTSEEAHTPMRR